MSCRSFRFILALDFDGVVCDSIAECLATSYLAYCRSNPRVSRECPGRWQSLFRARRGVVRPSGHYLLLWDWITRFADRDLSPDQFEELGRGQQARLQDFEHLFHSLRDLAIKDDPERFVALNPLYPGVIESWPALREWPLYIVSTKDEPAIKLILQTHRLEVEGVFGRGSGSKAQTLCSLAALHQVPPEQVVFIDDNALHVADASAAGITAVVANWGYGPQDPSSRVSLSAFDEIPLLLSRLSTGR
jgi:FMN phosphatase YigB (HAD superfamily)